MPTTSVQAIGKVLSKRNTNRLKTLFSEIGRILIDSNVVAIDDLRSLIGEEGEEESSSGKKNLPDQSEKTEAEKPEDTANSDDESSDEANLSDKTPEGEPDTESEAPAELEAEAETKVKPEAAPEGEQEPISTEEANAEIEASGHSAAGLFSAEVRRVTWHDRLRRTLDLFKFRFPYLQEVSKEEFKRIFGEEKDRVSESKAIIKDLTNFLEQLVADHPGPCQDVGLPYLGGRIDQDYPLMAQAKEALEKITEEIIKDEELEFLDIHFQCRARERHPESNRHPIEGVLFKIDEASEAAPAIGPGLPLYVPRSVAESIVDRVNGLPLDADDSLSKHANRDITGVILSAEIKGNDFIVRGFLWPWNQTEKVTAIAANREKLGMSMNAKAVGRRAKINGADVFHIDSLELLGANILFSERATYQQTRLLAASQGEQVSESVFLFDGEFQEEDSEAEIAAETSSESFESSHSLPPEIPIMSIELIQAQLKAINSTLESVARIAESVDEMRNELIDLQSEIGDIKREKEEKEATIKAQRLQEDKDAEHQRLAEMIQSMIQKSLNPSGQPPRKTYPISASIGATTEEPKIGDLEARLIAAEGKLDVLRETNGNRQKRLEVIEEIRALKAQLNQ